jgi:hypothetical protein
MFIRRTHHGKCNRLNPSFSLGYVAIISIFLTSSITVESLSPTLAEHTEDRYTHNLRDTFMNWKETMKNFDTTNFNHTKSDESAIPRVIFFNKCKEDVVNKTDQVAGNENEIILNYSPGTVCYDKLYIKTVKTSAIETGLPSGRTEVIFTDGTRLQANIKSGSLHGLVKKVRCVVGSCVPDEEDPEYHAFQAGEMEEEEATYLSQLIVYTDGIPETSLYGWWFPIDGGAIYCTPSKRSQATGEECVYLYPDIQAGIVGHWKDGRMVLGQPAILQSFVMSAGLLKPEMRILEDREPYTHFQSTNTNISDSPMVSDIYEELHLYVGPSTLPNAGEGLFAKTRFNAGDIISFYNGVRYTKSEQIQKCGEPSSRYSVGSWEDETIDIPKKSQSRQFYIATLGHKANDNRGYPNAFYQACDHPRFGEITCVMASRNIQENEEIFAEYGPRYWSFLPFSGQNPFQSFMPSKTYYSEGDQMNKL